MARILFFYLGLLLMAFSILLPIFPLASSERWTRSWIFDFGLLLAVAAHGWPGVL